MAQLQRIMGSGFGAQTSRLLNGTLVDGLVATGSSQTDALQLVEDTNIIVQTDPGTGVKLPRVPQPGDEIAVFNMGLNNLAIYPGLGGALQGGTANQPYSITPGNAAVFTARRGSQDWVAFATGTVSQILNGMFDFSDLNQSDLLPLLESI